MKICRTILTAMCVFALAGLSPAQTQTASHKGATHTQNVFVPSSATLVDNLLIETTGSAAPRALDSLGVAYDYMSTDDFTTIDFSPYSTILIAMDGGDVDTLDVEAVANAAASGKKLIMIGGTNWATYYAGMQQYLLQHNDTTGWQISGNPHLTVTDPGSPLTMGLPSPYDYVNSSAANYMLRITDPAADVVAVNGDGYPALVSKPIGAGTLIYSISSPFDSYYSDDSDFQVLKTIVRNALGFNALNPPRNLIAFSGDNYVDLWWQEPESAGDTLAIAYHDGTFEGQLGCSGINTCELAVRFTPPSYPVQLLGFEFSQQNSSTSQVEMKVYLDPAGSVTGPPLPAVMTYPGLGGSDGFYSLDISSDNLVVTSGDFYLGAMETNGFMGLAMDTTNQNGYLDRNWASTDGAVTFDILKNVVGGAQDLYGNLHITAIVLTSAGMAKVHGDVVEYISEHEIKFDPAIGSTNTQKPQNTSRSYCLSKIDVFGDGQSATPVKSHEESVFAHLNGKGNSIEGLDGYNIYRSMDGLSFSNIGFVNALSYRDNTVANGNTYWYFVTAVYTEGESSPSDTVKATPNVPPPGGTLFASDPRTESLITIDPNNGAGTLVGSTFGFGGITEIEFREDGLLYGSTGGGSRNIVTINVFTGESTLLGQHDYGAVNGLEFSPGGTLFGTYVSTGGGIAPSDLVIVDQNDGSLTFIGQTGFNNIGGLAFASDGTLYGVTSADTNGQLVTIDTTTGAATLVGPTGFPKVGSLEFGPNGVLYAGLGAGGVQDSGSVITINPATGAGTLVGSTGFDAISGLSFYPGPTVSIDDGISGHLSQRFDLSQNYPNPFNPTTTVEYQLPEAARVKITIYNTLGQKLRTLVDEFKQAGEHQAKWDGLDESGVQVATGVYLYRIQAGDFVKTRKMILLK